MITYELKLNPNQTQTKALSRELFGVTGVYNWSIKQLESHFVVEEMRMLTTMSAVSQRSLLSGKILGHAKKCRLSSRAINATIARAITSHSRFKNKVSGKPKLKGKRNQMTSFDFLGDVKINLEHFKLKIPNQPWLKFCKDKGLPTGKLKTVTIIHRCENWCASCVFDGEPKSIQVVGNGIVGGDPGLSSALTLSTGETFENPRYFENEEENIARKQRGGSKKKSAKAHRRLANRRRDRQHKLSRKLVSENREIYYSDDNYKAMKGLFGKSIDSLAPAALARMIEYKALCRTDGRGKFVRVNSRNTTRTCSSCWCLSGPTGLSELSVRHWTCACGAHHDRDVNAAKVVLMLGQGVAFELHCEMQPGIMKERSVKGRSAVADQNPEPAP